MVLLEPLPSGAVKFKNSFLSKFPSSLKMRKNIQFTHLELPRPTTKNDERMILRLLQRTSCVAFFWVVFGSLLRQKFRTNFKNCFEFEKKTRTDIRLGVTPKNISWRNMVTPGVKPFVLSHVATPLGLPTPLAKPLQRTFIDDTLTPSVISMLATTSTNSDIGNVYWDLTWSIQIYDQDGDLL